VTRYKERSAIYLAAIIDGEGSVSLHSGKWLQVIITNTDPDILEGVKSHLEVLAIHYRVQRHSSRMATRTCYSVQVLRKAEIARLASYVCPYMCCATKRHDLDAARENERLRQAIIA